MKQNPWKEKQGRIHGIRYVLARTDTSFGHKWLFCMVSTHVWRTDQWTDGRMDGLTDGWTDQRTYMPSYRDASKNGWRMDLSIFCDCPSVPSMRLSVTPFDAIVRPSLRCDCPSVTSIRLSFRHFDAIFPSKLWSDDPFIPSMRCPTKFWFVNHNRLTTRFSAL